MGVAYLNSTGKPIAVFVSVSITSNSLVPVCAIDGLIMKFVDGSGGQLLPLMFIVPNNSTYVCYSNNAYVANESWLELR